MMLEDKIVTQEEALAIIKKWQESGEKVVFTNGCFDLLHAGHVRYLQRAKALGKHLIVAVNSDASVRALKGPQRPIQPAADRAAVIAALESVDLVIVFEEERVDRLLALLHPNIYAKGGDYTTDSLYHTEREVMESYGVEIVILPLDGPSTSEIIEQIQKKANNTR
jgi:D-beta-D-heptose 7-phosphate kinase/D-beta-D-heptose 1-phosphate adenosyltransferase